MNDDKAVQEVAEKLCECSCHLERGTNRACFYCANAHNFEGLVAPKSQFADWRDENDKLYKTWPEAAQAYADYLCVSLTRELQAIREAAEAVLSVKLERDCNHEEEYDYCDGCAYEYQKEMLEAKTNLRAALEGK